MIVASHSPEFLKHYCNKAIVIHQTKATMYDDVNEAVERYEAL